MLEHRKGGIAMNTVLGVGALIIGVILTFVIIDTLDGANLMTTGRTTTTVTNETDARLNTTTYTLTNVDVTRTSYTLTAIWADSNQTAAAPDNLPEGYSVVVPLANASTSTGGVVTNATEIDLPNVSLSYTYVTYSSGEQATDRISGNMTDGIDNVSAKIPTILLIVAVVVLFGALVLLVAQSKRMGLGSSGGGL